MKTNYEKIILDNLQEIYKRDPAELQAWIPASRKNDHFIFRAFGEDCRLGPDKIILSGTQENGPKGLLISLYASHVQADPVKLEPFKAFKDLAGSMPYQGAFTANSERPLVPFVDRIDQNQGTIMETIDGASVPGHQPGDLALLLYPLPKIALCYIFYLADDEFPASATCLYSTNALSFMPLDGLADVAEYTTKKILEIIQ
jgi:hypothetical protein